MDERPLINCPATVLSPQPGRRSYYAGDRIPDPGIYRVVHYQHRMPHLVTISLEQATFPSCRVCENRVCFEPMFEVSGTRAMRRPTDFAPESTRDIDLGATKAAE